MEHGDWTWRAKDCKMLTFRIEEVVVWFIGIEGEREWYGGEKYEGVGSGSGEWG